MEIKIYVFEWENLNIEFQMLEIRDFAILSFENDRVLSVFALFPHVPWEKGDDKMGRPPVLCHSTQDLEFYRLALYVVRTQI